MLLVQRSEAESKQDLFAYLSARYDPRIDDPDWGPLYRIGPTFTYHDRRFSQIQTFAGSLVMQIVFDVHKHAFERPVIFRFSSEERFKLVSLDGSESELADEELVCSED